MAETRIRVAYCALALAFLPIAHSQEAGPSSTVTLKVSAQLVLVDATVQDKKTGKPIDDLARNDFLLTEDNVPQTLTYLSENRLPLSIVLMFDLTDSVRPVLKPLAAGAQQTLTHLKAEDEVAVMVFSSRATLLQDFTTDHALIAAAIDKAAAMHDREATFIHEDVWESTQQATKATIPNSRRVEVWLTDGTSNYENKATQKMYGRHSPDQLHSRQEAIETLTGSGVVVSALLERSALTDVSLPLAFMSGRVGDIANYAELTGGPVLRTGKQDVPERLAALLDAIRQRYTLGYKPLPPKPSGTLCHIRLELSPSFLAKHPGLSVKNLVIRAKQTYYR